MSGCLDKLAAFCHQQGSATAAMARQGLQQTADSVSVCAIDLAMPCFAQTICHCLWRDAKVLSEPSSHWQKDRSTALMSWMQEHGMYYRQTAQGHNCKGCCSLVSFPQHPNICSRLCARDRAVTAEHQLTCNGVCDRPASNNALRCFGHFVHCFQTSDYLTSNSVAISSADSSS